MLPNFIIAGAARSGTTSLYRYCAEHPQVFMSRVKETNFFSSNPFEFTRSTYEQLFEDARQANAVGEASPSYLYDESAPYAIKKAIPECRIVIILRDPSERLVSDFYYSQSWGCNLDTDFSTFLTACLRGVGSGQQGFVPALMAQKGFYDGQVRRFFKVFPRDCIFVRLFEDLRDEPAKVLSELYEFLGVDPAFKPELEKVHNVNSEVVLPALSRLIKRVGRIEDLFIAPYVPSTAKGRMTNAILSLNRKPRPQGSTKISISIDDRERLKQMYHHSVLELEQLLDRDLGHWLHATRERAVNGTLSDYT